MTSTARFVRLALLSAAWTAAACSGSADTGKVGAGSTPDAGVAAGRDQGTTSDGPGDPPPDAGAAPVDAAGGPIFDLAGFTPGPHAVLPQLVTPVGTTPTATNTPLGAPKVVGVFFANYDNSVAMTSWLAALPTLRTEHGQPYWSSAVGEYGVGALTALPPVVLSIDAPADFGQWDYTKEPALAKFGGDTLIAIFYPDTTTFNGGRCWGMADGGVATDPRRFAFVSECPGQSGAARLDQLSRDTSYWLATLAIAGSWRFNDAGWIFNIYWPGIANPAGACLAQQTQSVRGGANQPYLLSRVWSNRAVAANDRDPCQPDLMPAQPYVAAVPLLPDRVVIQGITGQGQGVLIKDGNLGATKKTIDVQCVSYATSGDFTIGAQAWGSYLSSLSFSWDSTTCHNGETRKLTITTGADLSYQLFQVWAQLPNAPDTQKPLFYGVIVNQ